MKEEIDFLDGDRKDGDLNGQGVRKNKTAAEEIEWSKLLEANEAAKKKVAGQVKTRAGFFSFLKGGGELDEARERVLGGISQSNVKSEIAEKETLEKPETKKSFWTFLFAAPILEKEIKQEVIDKTIEKKIEAPKPVKKILPIEKEEPAEEKMAELIAIKELAKRDKPDLKNKPVERHFWSFLRPDILSIKKEKEKQAVVEQSNQEAVNMPAAAKSAEAVKTTPSLFKPREEVKLQMMSSNLIKEEIFSYIDWRKNIFYIAVFLFLAVMAIAGTWFYFDNKLDEAERIADLPSLKIKTEELKSEFAKLSGQLEEVNSFKAKIVAVSDILAKKIYWNNFFALLEERTQEGVGYGDFTGDTGGKYSFSVEVADYAHMALFIDEMRKSDYVKSVECSEGRMGKEGVAFSFTLEVDPGIFLKK